LAAASATDTACVRRFLHSANIWLFLKLDGNHIYTDTDRYFLDALNLPRLLGVLLTITDFYDTAGARPTR
jgi:hypothetical protein